MDTAAEVIRDIYMEGDIDITFFGQILTYVSTDGEENLLDKAPQERMFDAIRLAEYLVSTGDFRVGRTIRKADNTFLYLPFEKGISEFKAFVMNQFSEAGIDDVDLHFTTWIQKILPGKQPSAIPIEIANLFAG